MAFWPRCRAYTRAPTSSQPTNNASCTTYTAQGLASHLALKSTSVGRWRNSCCPVGISPPPRKRHSSKHTLGTMGRPVPPHSQTNGDKTSHPAARPCHRQPDPLHQPHPATQPQQAANRQPITRPTTAVPPPAAPAAAAAAAQVATQYLPAKHGTHTPQPPLVPQTHSRPADPQVTTHDRRFRQALATLDDVDLPGILQQRCFFFQRPPQFLKGRIRQALSFALVSITAAQTPVESTRAWTLWLLLPRMLLHRPPGTKVLPKADWHRRMRAFQEGQWEQLIQQACPDQSTLTPPVDNGEPSLESRAARHDSWSNSAGCRQPGKPSQPAPQPPAPSRPSTNCGIPAEDPWHLTGHRSPTSSQTNQNFPRPPSCTTSAEAEKGPLAPQA